MLRTVAKSFPKLKIVAAHLGGFGMWEEVLEKLAGVSNVWLDTALCESFINDDIFYKILNKHGYERLLMATDWPWKKVKDTIVWLEQKKLKTTELDAILGENAKTLLKIN
jgi:predicted TIM-barrel fold metal-dependent hydrolase